LTTSLKAPLKRRAAHFADVVQMVGGENGAMNTHAHPGKAPPVTRAVEALSLAALANLWRSLDKLLPLWFGLAAFHAMARAAVHVHAADAWPLQAIIDNEASTLTLMLVSALASAVALRIFLGRGRDALRVNPWLAGYVGIVILLGIAPAMILMGVHSPAPGASPTDLHVDMVRMALALATGFTMFWVSLRLTLWPIARLLGDNRVTGGQSWTLMRGAAARYAGTLGLLIGPMVLLNYLLDALTTEASPLIHAAATAPLSAAITLTTAAVAAEVYKNRMNV
jgi:hypothetical protein